VNRVKITHNCFVNGTPIAAGTVLEIVEESLAGALINSGRACLAPAIKDAPKPVEKRKSAKKKGK
jgi:hypothetical protein